MISVAEAAAIAAMSGGNQPSPSGFPACELRLETTSNKTVSLVELLDDEIPYALVGTWQGLRTFTVLKGSALVGLDGVGGILIIEGEAKDATSLFGVPAVIINGDCYLEMLSEEH